MIYLASPYSHHDKTIPPLRYEEACSAAAWLFARGELVISPIVHCHPLVTYGMRGDWTFWRTYAIALLKRCDEFAVLKLDGWKESEGLRNELRIARLMGLPIGFIEKGTANEGTWRWAERREDSDSGRGSRRDGGESR